MTPQATQTLPGGRTAIFMEKAGHFRTLDTLGLLLKRGKIDRAAHDAGQNFAEDFFDAQLGGTKAIDYAATRGGQPSADSMTEHAAFARRRVHQALDAVGGIGSPSGKVLWDIVGLGTPLTQVAQAIGRDRREVIGMLISTLFVLARHYGFIDSPLQ
jgi:hypothetical protein